MRKYFNKLRFAIVMFQIEMRCSVCSDEVKVVCFSKMFYSSDPLQAGYDRMVIVWRCENCEHTPSVILQVSQTDRGNIRREQSTCWNERSNIKREPRLPREEILISYQNVLYLQGDYNISNGKTSPAFLLIKTTIQRQPSSRRILLIKNFSDVFLVISISDR